MEALRSISPARLSPRPLEGLNFQSGCGNADPSAGRKALSKRIYAYTSSAKTTKGFKGSIPPEPSTEPSGKKSGRLTGKGAVCSSDNGTRIRFGTGAVSGSTAGSEVLRGNGSRDGEAILDSMGRDGSYGWGGEDASLGESEGGASSEVDLREGWHPLVTLWEDDAEAVVESGRATNLLSPPWRVMLLSDGSVTRHLQLLTGIQVAVDCREMRQIGDSLAGLPPEVGLLAGPRLQRQVYLRTVEGEVLAYAASWWSAEEVGGYLREVKEPIWVNFSRQRRELFRSVQRLYLGHSPALAKSFGAPGPFWARHYVFYQSGRALTVIYEVFSPALEKYLGPSGMAPEQEGA